VHALLGVFVLRKTHRLKVLPQLLSILTVPHLVYGSETRRGFVGL
jgi:hypothetical protein